MPADLKMSALGIPAWRIAATCWRISSPKASAASVGEGRTYEYVHWHQRGPVPPLEVTPLPDQLVSNMWSEKVNCTELLNTLYSNVLARPKVANANSTD
jgi:hypothetical protein